MWLRGLPGGRGTRSRPSNLYQNMSAMLRLGKEIWPETRDIFHTPLSKRFGYADLERQQTRKELLARVGGSCL